MPQGVEDVKGPMMPQGVEHETDWVRAREVKGPMMPQGVEHQRHAAAGRRERTNDAARR